MIKRLLNLIKHAKPWSDNMTTHLSKDDVRNMIVQFNLNIAKCAYLDEEIIRLQKLLAVEDKTCD